MVNNGYNLYILSLPHMYIQYTMVILYNFCPNIKNWSYNACSVGQNFALIFKIWNFKICMIDKPVLILALWKLNNYFGTGGLNCHFWTNTVKICQSVVKVPQWQISAFPFSFCLNLTAIHNSLQIQPWKYKKIWKRYFSVLIKIHKYL